jgi:hypothetical protein
VGIEPGIVEDALWKRGFSFKLVTGTRERHREK